jgi:ABC-type molybdate transport system permease subunit
MATLSENVSPSGGVQDSERQFFRVMALVMAAVVVSGFTLNLAMGRSTFAVPVVYHTHAFVFFSWVALYVAQKWLLA